MAELKPKSLRVEDETFGKFKTISAEIGGNQQETLELLIGNYETQRGKENLVGRKEDIEQFEKYINALMHMYMRVLEDNQNMKDTTRLEFKTQLDSKDEIIVNLQKKEKDYLAEIEHYKSLAEQSQKHEQEHLESIDTLHQNLDHLSDDYEEKVKRLQSSLLDKENLNNMLNKRLISLDGLERENKILADKVSVLENEKLEFHKKIISLKENYNDKIAELKEQYAAEIDKYQTKYRELLEKLEQKAEQLTKKASAKSASTTRKNKQPTKKGESVEAVREEKE